MDMTAEVLELHMRTDANNLVTTASTTHLPEQQETVHMINQLRHEVCSGAIQDLAHVVSNDCLADCLTKASANPESLIKAVNTGILPNVDKHQPFRELIQNRHKAYWALAEWVATNLNDTENVHTFLGFPMQEELEVFYSSVDWYDSE